MNSDWLPFSCDIRESLEERDALLRKYSVLVPPVVILFNEFLLYFDHVQYALWGYLVVLFTCVFALFRLTEGTETFRAFVLVAAFRLVTLGMPAFFESSLYRLVLVYGPLLPSLYLVGRTRMQTLSFDWKSAVLALPLALPASVLLAEIEYRLLSPDVLLADWSVAQLVVVCIVMVGFVGLVEELLFRGLLQRALQNRFGRWTGLVLASVLFGAMYSGYGIPIEPVYATAMGLLLGLVYDWIDSLALVTVVHGLQNVFLFAVIPIQGSFIGF